MGVCRCRWLWEKPSNEVTTSQREQRWAWWFAGFATGPDTVNAVFWSVAVIYFAGLDSTCGINPQDGLSSGANDMACLPNSYWNDTLFLALNGSSCVKTVGFQTGYHNLPTPACQEAFTGYRDIQPDYTCNCSNSPYAFLGGTGGQRPANVLSLASVATNLVIAFSLPVLGTWVDSSPYRRQVFFYNGMMTGVVTAMGSIMARDYIWVGGLFFTVLTAVFYEFSYVGIVPYLPELAPDDQSKGKLAGLRQAAGLTAQFLFAGLVFAIGNFMLGLDDVGMAMVGNSVCFVWVCGLLPLSYRALVDRPALTETNGSNVCSSSFRSLYKTFSEAKKYKQTFLYLLMHVFAGSGAGSIITQLPTYAVVQVELSSFEILVVTLALLIFAIPSALLYAFVLVKYLRPKTIQIMANVWLIVFVCGFTLFVNKPGQFAAAVVAGMAIGVGFGLFYSVEIANYMKIIPVNQKAEFAALYGFFSYLPRFIPPLVYASIVHALNDHQIAFLSIGVYLVISLMLLLCIDLDKGEADARAGADLESSSPTHVKVVSDQLNVERHSGDVAMGDLPSADRAE